MRENLTLIRPYLVLLAVFAAGRWTLGVRGVPYADGHHYFSLVMLTVVSAVLYGAFTRQWLRYPVSRAMVIGALLAACSQLVILAATVASYALGIDTYFNNPMAVVRDAQADLSFGRAVASRLGGGVVNVATMAVAGALGWFMGAVLPARGTSVRA